MTAAPPIVTVVMPVFNALPYLDAAIASILAQTLSDFRLAIYDDCSTDGSFERAREWSARDPRIDVTRGARRLGPSASSQAAALLAKTEFVARMDADDIAHPERLQLLIEALEARPEAVLAGSIFELIDAAGEIILKAAPHRISGTAPPFGHASIMYRNAAFRAAGGYRAGTEYYEDLDLYRRMSAQGELLVINRPLLQMRFAGQNARLRDEKLAVLDRIDRQHAGYAERQLAQGKILPVSFYALAVLSILALERPRLLGLMARHAHKGNLLSLFAAATMIAIAEVSPRLARGISFGLNALREIRSRRRYQWHGVCRWQFPASGSAEHSLPQAHAATA